AHRLLADGDAGAVDQDTRLSMRLGPQIQSGSDAVLAGYVHSGEDAAQFFCDRTAALFVDVEDGNLGAGRSQFARRGFTQSRCPAGDDGGDSLKFHYEHLLDLMGFYGPPSIISRGRARSPKSSARKALA